MNSLQELTDRLAILQREINIIESTLQPLREEVRSINLKIREIKRGFKIGDTVESRGKRFVITRMNSMFNYGKLVKKDGTLGVGERYIYEPVTLVPLPALSDEVAP